jgi:prepilin-type N-terminal cleavage/methylation domain-containing protein
MPGASFDARAMSPVRFGVRSGGFSLLEVLLVTSIVATLAAVSIPVTAGALDELRTSMAARYLEARIMNARATAVKRSTRVGFGLHSGVPDVDGSLSTGSDGLRIGSSRILTLGSDGTATSGTLYVRGRRGQYAVRILGITGRTRVLRFHPVTGQWITP